MSNLQGFKVGQGYGSWGEQFRRSKHKQAQQLVGTDGAERKHSEPGVVAEQTGSWSQTPSGIHSAEEEVKEQWDCMQCRCGMKDHFIKINCPKPPRKAPRRGWYISRLARRKLHGEISDGLRVVPQRRVCG